jgi:Cys-tRNA(Pro)/Cys-tRNA(Cys) deacylase
MKSTNNITRLLDARRIPYTSFELPAEKLSALQTASMLAVAPEVIYKTLVVNREKPKKPLLVMIPATTTLDLKLLAAAIGEKKVFLPTEREAETLTGLQAGGISALALLNKGFPVVLDASAKQHKEIHISGGQRGLNIRLPVDALLALTNARLYVVGRAGADDG